MKTEEAAPLLVSEEWPVPSLAQEEATDVSLMGEDRPLTGVHLSRH